MFRSSRTKATYAAVEAVRPIIGTLQYHYGLPPQFWFDPYVLGFMNFTIGNFAKAATSGKIGGADLGFVLADTYTALSNRNGAEIMKQATALALSDDPDFNKGEDDAAAIQFYTMGILKNEASSELVQRATALAEKMDESALTEGDKRSRIAGIMMTLSFVAEVRSRFDL